MTKEQKFSDALAVQVERRIFLVRGQKVMLDKDLAELYRVPTKSLNLAVKRNADRFPEDFTFQLTDDEAAGLSAVAVAVVIFPTPSPSRASRCFPACCAVRGPCRSTSPSCAHLCGCARCSSRIRNLPASLPRSKTNTTPSLRSSSTPSAS